MHAKSKQKIKTEEPSNGGSQRKSTWNLPVLLCLLLIAVATYVIFSGAKDNQFVNWDDQVYVEEQPLVLEKKYNQLLKTPVSLNYHPVTMISLAFQVPKDVKKLSPKPFIHLNIWLHIFNSLLVFVLIWMINERKWMIALLTALIFALHPSHTESVVWVSERKDVLYTFFFLSSMIVYWHYTNKGKYHWLLLSFMLFLLSVLSKAMAVSLPLMLLLLDYWKGRNLREVSIWLEKIPFFAASLFFGLMAISVQKGGDFGGILTLLGEKTKAVADAEIFSFWQSFQFASYGFVNYIIQFFAPFKICAFYPYPKDFTFTGAASFMYPIIFLLILTITLWSAFRTKIVAFGIGFYFVTVALVLQFLSVGLAIMADRYTYVPFIGLAFLVVYAVDFYVTKFKLSKYVTYSLLGIFVIMLATKTKSQVDVWQNSETLWSQVIKYYPNEDLALANRGNYLGKSGNIQGAMADFELAIADGCKRADVYEGLGNSYGTLSMQQPNKRDEYRTKAIDMYRQALSIDSTKGNIHFNLGVTLLQADPLAAANSFHAALKYMPYKEKDILPTYGVALINAGKYQESINVLTKALSLGQSDELYYNRSLAYIGINNKDAAIADLRQALAINPKNQSAQIKLSEL